MPTLKANLYFQSLQAGTPTTIDPVDLSLTQPRLTPEHLHDADDPDFVGVLAQVTNARLHHLQLVAHEPGKYALYAYQFEDKWYQQWELEAHLLEAYGAAPDNLYGTFLLVEAQ